ncbi:MAG: PAS domain S-box protein [Candidatus Thorarchaeota archaeon]
MLLVDDDLDLLGIAELLLPREEPSVNLVTATSAQEALQKMKEDVFDAVVSDYVMPGMDGLTFLQTLRDAGNLIPFIIFTGQGREEVAMKALNLGANYYLMKGREVKSVFGELAHIIRQVVEHRQTEEALRESEARFAAFMEHIPAITFIRDLQDRHIFVNKLGEKYSTEDWHYKTTKDLWPEDTAEQLIATDQRVLSEKRSIQTIETLPQADEVHQLLTVKFPILDENGEPQYLAGAAIDITEQKMMEKALQVQQEFTDQVIDSLTDTFYIFDPEDGRAIRWNRVFEEIGGYSYEEMKRNTPLDYYPPEEHCRIEEAVREILETGRSNVELTWITKSGRRVPFEYSAVLIQSPEGKPWICAIGRDISERKQAEAMLHESEEKYQSLINNIPVVTWLSDSEGGTSFISPNVEKIYGFTPKEIYEGGEALWFGRIHPDDVERVKDKYQGLFVTKEPFEVEYRIQRKDGEWIWLYDRAITIFEEGGVAQAYGVFEDITKRKLTEDALHESEQQFRAIFENVAIGMVVGSFDGEITATNSAFQNFLGYSAEELKQITYRDYTHPEDLPRDEELFQEMLEKKRNYYQIEKRYIRKDGQIKWGRLTASIVRDENDHLPIGIGMVEDITKGKQAEEALQESEALFHVLLNATDDSILLLDTKGTILAINRAEIERLNKPEEELLGNNIFDHYPPTIADQRKNAFDEVIQSGSSLHRVSDDSGRIFESNMSPIFGPSGNVERVAIFSRDITKRKQAEMAYQSVIESMVHGIAIYQEGQFVFANRAMREITGYRIEELLAFSLEEIRGLVHPDDREFLIKRQRDWLEGKPVHSRYSCRLIRKDGTFRWIEGFTNPVEFQGKSATQQTIIDISERKQAQELLQQQKKELSDFVHTMAHDLRNQLLSVEGYAEALQEEYNLIFVGKIQYLAQHMGQLLRRSVALADAGLIIERTADVELTQLAQEISETAIPSNIDFVVKDLPVIAGDREKLAQIFQNLFENAVTHGKPTKITVRGQRGERGTEILIANDGKPIPPEDRPKIFQRGFSTEEGRSGLGLAIVQKLVTAHGWQIDLADSPETAFIIRIPATS